ncbi:MAG: hypothetical protein HZY76_08460 [Anaerolineae bacterium]|nr:MAG: hypothetical protein HZY76_08460 [Anaerolineae bacterium]
MTAPRQRGLPPGRRPSPLPPLPPCGRGDVKAGCFGAAAAQNTPTQRFPAPACGGGPGGGAAARGRGPSELVKAKSAVEGDVVFVVPETAVQAVLQVGEVGKEQPATMPLNLKGVHRRPVAQRWRSF